MLHASLRLALIAFCAAIVAVALPVAAAVEPSVTTNFFSGDARSTNMFSTEQSSEKVLLIRAVDAKRGTIVETACVKAPTTAALVSPIYIRLTPDGAISVSDVPSGIPRAVRGTGHAWGQRGEWNRLHFSMTYGSGRGAVQIEDENYLVRDRLIARKIISLPNGNPVELWEAELTSTEPAAFWRSWSAQGCAPQPSG